MSSPDKRETSRRALSLLTVWVLLSFFFLLPVMWNWKTVKMDLYMQTVTIVSKHLLIIFHPCTWKLRSWTVKKIMRIWQVSTGRAFPQVELEQSSQWSKLCQYVFSSVSIVCLRRSEHDRFWWLNLMNQDKKGNGERSLSYFFHVFGLAIKSQEPLPSPV